MTATDATAPRPLPPVITVDITLVDEPPQNPNHLPPDKFELLVRAIDALGFNQPLLVRAHPTEPTRYEIVDGVHRCRAAKRLGYAVLPAVVCTADQAQAVLAQLGMNRLRGDLNLTDASKALSDLLASGTDKELLQLSGFTQGEVDDMLRVALATSPEHNLLDEPVGLPPSPPPTQPGNPKPFALEFTFATKAQMDAVKRKLRKAAGKGQPIEQGLLAVLELK